MPARIVPWASIQLRILVMFGSFGCGLPTDLKPESDPAPIVAGFWNSG